MSALKPYAKAVIGLALSAVASFLTQKGWDGLTLGEVVKLAGTAVLTGLGVYAVPNTPKS